MIFYWVSLFFSCCRSVSITWIKTTCSRSFQNNNNNGFVTKNRKNVSISRWSNENYRWTTSIQRWIESFVQFAEVNRIELNRWIRRVFSSSRKLSSIAQTSNLAGAEEIRHRSNCSAVHHRYLWLRTALIHRSLHKIVEYIVENSSSVVSISLLWTFFIDLFSFAENITNRMHWFPIQLKEPFFRRYSVCH